MEFSFSQIILCCNQKEILPRAVESVLTQSVLPDQIVIGDDGSTDGSPGLIREYMKKKPGLIQGVFSETNRGIAGNINRCVKAARGTFVSLLAGDDYLLPEKFRVQFRAIREFFPEYRVFYSDCVATDKKTGKKSIWGNRGREGEVFSLLARRRFHMRNHFFHKDLFLDVGGCDEGLLLYEDWKLKLELSLNAKIKYCPGVFSGYEIGESGANKTPFSVQVKYIEKAVGNLIEKYDLRGKNLRYLKGTLAHFQTLASPTLGRKLLNGIKTNVYDPGWFVPQMKGLAGLIRARFFGAPKGF